MHVFSFSGPTSKQAMADLRAALGENAIILGTRTMADGHVTVSGGVVNDVWNLTDVLTPSSEPRSREWLHALTEFHEWRFAAAARVAPILEKITSADPETVLTTLMQALFRFNDRSTSQRSFLFSGPPGSGKTVTVAKLAAATVLAGDTVDIVTFDHGRAGSLDQLETLLAPLDKKPIPVEQIADLPRVLSRCRSDVVLLDSAGVNPFDPKDLSLLSRLTEQAEADLLLVLPAGLGSADSADIARNYLALGAKSMVVTKLDIARRLGGVLAAAEAGLGFAEVGIGPTIGDGLSSLSAGGLARLLLRRYRSSIVEESCS